MNEKDVLSCAVCRDLLPLVRDGIASDEARQAVEKHAEACAPCRALLRADGPLPADAQESGARVLRALRRRVRLVVLFALALCALFGAEMTAGSDMFYNSLLMPALGAMGYAVFRTKAFYRVPLLIFAAQGLAGLLNLRRGDEPSDAASLLMWAGLYSLLALVGVLAAFSVYRALRGPGGTTRKAVCLAAAGCLTVGVCLFANALVGNPVSYLLARNGAQKHLDGQYAGSDYALERVTYSFKTGSYLAYAAAPDSEDRHFTLWLDGWGHVQRDDFTQMVTEGENTARRLDMAYRALADTVLESPLWPYKGGIAFGSLQFLPSDSALSEEAPGAGIPRQTLVPDGLYDIPALGAAAGHLTVYAEDETVSAERAAEMLLEIRRLMEAGGVPFDTVDFVLEYPRAENETRPAGRVEVRDFPYRDIYEQGLAARVEAADRRARAQDEALYAQKQEETGEPVEKR